jgi:hypothetical protein
MKGGHELPRYTPGKPQDVVQMLPQKILHTRALQSRQLISACSETNGGKGGDVCNDRSATLFRVRGR